MNPNLPTPEERFQKETTLFRNSICNYLFNIAFYLLVIACALISASIQLADIKHEIAAKKIHVTVEKGAP